MQRSIMLKGVGCALAVELNLISQQNVMLAQNVDLMLAHRCVSARNPLEIQKEYVTICLRYHP